MLRTDTAKPKKLTKPEIRVVEFLQQNKGWEMASGAQKTVFWLRDRAMIGRYGKNKPVIATVALSLLDKGALRFQREQYSTYAYVLDPARIAALMPAPKLSPLDTER